jgi:hypothetical protein
MFMRISAARQGLPQQLQKKYSLKPTKTFGVSKNIKFVPSKQKDYREALPMRIPTTASGLPLSTLAMFSLQENTTFWHLSFEKLFAIFCSRHYTD